tara:strand:+ start:14283 stop:14765 length:483 start_codon:yes stop_codon:yes gene_type:complete
MISKLIFELIHNALSFFTRVFTKPPQPTQATIVDNIFLELNRNNKKFYFNINEIGETTINDLFSENFIKKKETNYFIPYLLLFINNKMYNIILETKNFSYYTTGIILNRDFYKHYLEKYYKKNLKENDIYYTKMVDININNVLLENESEIYLDKDKYIVI